MIIRGGENIYCVEIENRLVEHPRDRRCRDHRRAAPRARRGGQGGRSRSTPGADLTDDDVQRVGGRDAGADSRCPTYVEFRDEKLPRNASGKLLKNVLRGEGEVSFQETM